MMASSTDLRIADHIRRLRPYHPGRPIEDVQREHGLTDIIKLASNENSLGPSPRAVQAMKAACEKVAYYPDASCIDLRSALSSHLGVSSEQIVIGNGSDDVIHILGLVFLQPGDEVILAHPTFSRYESAAVLGQCPTFIAPLVNHTYDLRAMADAFTAHTRLVFISNPNNPTGTMNTADQIEALIAKLPDQAILVLDEAYAEYVEDPAYPAALEHVQAGHNVIVLRTFSKIYGLAGLRVGYGVARPDIVHFINQVREPFNVNLVAQAGALAALEDQDHVERSRELNRRGKAYLYDAFRKLGLEYIPSVANFVMVETGLPSREVSVAMERRGVIIRAGEAFGMPTWIRVTIGTPSECERFIKALTEVLAA